jgi:hypothetical protein
MRTVSWLRRAAPAMALCLALAACSSGQPSSSARPKQSSPTAEPSTGPAAIAAVKANWQRFVNGTTPIPQRLSLLQDGQRFASFVHSQENTTLGLLVFSTSGKVTAVTLGPAGQANVTFNVFLNGKSLAKNLHGIALYSGGVWRVADTTFCDLLRQVYGNHNHLIVALCGG